MFIFMRTKYIWQKKSKVIDKSGYITSLYFRLISRDEEGENPREKGPAKTFLRVRGQQVLTPTCIFDTDTEYRRVCLSLTIYF